MIVLDTHVWIWWVHGDERLTRSQSETVKANEAGIIGVSAISCWEIAKLVEYNRLMLPCGLREWFEQALSYPGLQLIELTPEIQPNYPVNSIVILLTRLSWQLLC